jgi:hypothetical protein
MAYLPAITEEEIAPHVLRFWQFAITTSGVLLVILLSWFVFPHFWQGNYLWTAGAALVFASTLDRLYFDIKRRAAPDNRHFDPMALKKFRSAFFVEKFFAHAWILGTILLYSDHWTHH